MLEMSSVWYNSKKYDWNVVNIINENITRCISVYNDINSVK